MDELDTTDVVIPPPPPRDHWLLWLGGAAVFFALTLLILPGVVLMTVGPSILSTITELVEPGGFLP